MKRSLDDLALFGGTPAFPEPLHVGRPNVGAWDALIARLEDMFERRYLTNGGPYELEFERRVAEVAGVEHCVATCNATAALEILFRALGLRGEVIVPALTFVATAHALEWLGIKPIFCDVRPSIYTIDPAQVEELITPRTTAIVGVHLWGRPCDVDALAEIASRHRLRLLFDAAHAFACSHGGRMIGAFGDAEVFSFHATKFVNSFEGGAIVTNDPSIARRARLMRSFGFDGYDNVISVGTNGKMTEIAAAMGLTSLEHMAEFIDRNRSNYLVYLDQLRNIPGISLLTYNDEERCNFQYVVIEVDQDLTRISRDALVTVFHAENILARRYFYPGVHRMEPYASGHGARELPVTEQMASRAVTLPTGTAVDADDIRRICALLAWCVSNGEQIHARL
jgi:dTDP-4-amino-4,6-dideoxygalactose transaminase